MKKLLLGLTLLTASTVFAQELTPKQVAYVETARKQAIEIILEAAKSGRSKLNLELYAKKLETARIVGSDSNRAVAWVWFTNGKADDTIRISKKKFLGLSVTEAAGKLIHESVHLAGQLDECSAEFVTKEVQKNSLKSNGLLTLQYFKLCGLTNYTCGTPVIIKKDGSEASLMTRSKEWIGGQEVCDRIVENDINFNYKVSIEDILNNDVPDQLRDEMYSNSE